MTLDKILVLLSSLLGVVFTYWFFLMKKDKVVSVTSSSIDITVKGGYTPDVISIPKGKKTKINFTRSDPSTCLEEVILREFKIRKYLPLNQKVSIEILPEKSGTFPFECGMGMFHGKIIVS